MDEADCQCVEKHSSVALAERCMQPFFTHELNEWALGSFTLDV